MKSVKLEPVV